MVVARQSSIKNLLLILSLQTIPFSPQIKVSSFSIRTPLKHHNTYAISSSSSINLASSTATITKESKVKLNVLTNKKSIIYDGSEYDALSSLSSSIPKSHGDSGRILVTFITGKEEGTGNRYVGILPGSNEDGTDNDSRSIVIDKNIKLSIDNAAKIPKGISDEDAISTAMASLINIHCSLPRIDNVGGEGSDNSSSFVSGKVVVLGGGEYATFAAKGLSEIGVDVTLVSTNSMKVPGVKVLPPAVGEMEIGFSSVIGEFDSILDTLYSESDGVKYELNRLHKCSRYISTYNKAQDIIRDSGVFFGPNEVKKYENTLFSRNLQSFTQLSTTGTIPYQFGSNTLQKLLDSNIVFNHKKSNYKNSNNNLMIRTWSLKDFWEFTNWPRDTDGGLNSRFGLPVLTEIDLFEDNEEEEEEYVRAASSSQKQTIEINPFVTQVQNIEQLQEEILSPKRNCLLFLTAPNCKTCFRLKPAYTRLARQNNNDDDDDNDNNSVLYAQADVVTSRTGGKELGKLLGVEVVPTFMLFRGGSRFGPLINVSKLPSEKLDKAVQLLVSGRDWDASVLKELEK